MQILMKFLARTLENQNRIIEYFKTVVRLFIAFAAKIIFALIGILLQILQIFNVKTKSKREEMEVDKKSQYLNMKPASLQELIESLHIVFSSDKVNVETVQALMENYESNEEDWAKFADFDHHRYTRNLVDEGNGRFNLMVLCWGEGQGSSIHSHSNAHCFMKVLEGTLRESMFAWPEVPRKKAAMRQLAVNDYHRDQVAYINDSKGLHRVENPSHTDMAASLHLYSPPFSSCQCFDQRTSKVITTQVTFWTKYGQRTPFSHTDAARRPSSAVFQFENN